MQKFNNYIEYNCFRKKSAEINGIVISALISISYILYVIFCCINDNFSAVLTRSLSLIILIFISIFLERNKTRLTTFTVDNKFFRIRWHRFCIFILVLGIINAVSLILEIIRVAVLGTFDELNMISEIILSFYYIVSFVSLCWLANYMCCWLKTYRWEYEELTLTRTEKRMIIQEERKEYKQYKAETRKRNQVERKEKMENSWNNFKDNLSEEIDSIKSKCVPKKTTNPVTKYDKLQELNNLYNNGVISKEELEKARADILGK